MIARAALLLALASSVAAAQTVRGRVFQPDSVAPAPGVLVAASDARGIEVARTVTDERGQFVLNLARAGAVGLRALRVGYRPTTGPSVDVGAGETVAVRIVLTREAVRLSAVTVRRSDPCRTRDDARTRVADVWEEARKALLLANTGRAGRELVAEWTQYDRQFDSSGTRLVDQVVLLTRAPSERPFRSQDAAVLARDGYVVEKDGTIAYYAPDGDVLLSESFAATHCFQLAPAPDDAHGLIGLRFRPIDAARSRRDVEGTFWLDRESAELRFITFAFTGLPLAADRAEPGGRVEYTRLDEGRWLVTRWWIRMPELERVMPGTAAGARIRVVGPGIVLRGVKVAGGEVTSVERDGAVVFRARGSSLAVRLAPEGGGPVSEAAGTRVRLDGTDYAAVADSIGVAHFPHVLPGRYRMTATTPAIDSGRADAPHADVEIGGDSLRSVRLRLPVPGRLFDAAGLGLAPVPRLRVEVEFSVTDTLERAIAGVEIIATDAARTVHRLRSDSLGAALLTGLPPGEMRVEARMPGYHLAIGIVDVLVGRTPAQVLLERIEGTVLDAVRVEAEADELARYGAFEARRRSGNATASITRDEMLARGVINAWQMLRNVSAVELIEGPEGVLPASRRVQSIDLRSNNSPCYMRLAIDGVLIPEAPVNLAHRMPPVSEIHGIEVFGGPATIPSEFAGDQRNMVCGLIVVWTR